jgi:hypothetical protein
MGEAIPFNTPAPTPKTKEPQGKCNRHSPPQPPHPEDSRTSCPPLDKKCDSCNTSQLQATRDSQPPICPKCDGNHLQSILIFVKPSEGRQRWYPYLPQQELIRIIKDYEADLAFQKKRTEEKKEEPPVERNGWGNPVTPENSPSRKRKGKKRKNLLALPATSPPPQ